MDPALNESRFRESDLHEWFRCYVHRAYLLCPRKLNGTDPAISFTGRTEIEARRVYEIKLWRSDSIYHPHPAGYGGDRGRREKPAGRGGGIRISLFAARNQSEPRSFRYQTRRSEEGAFDRSLRSLQPRQPCPAVGEGKCQSRGRDGIRQTKRYSRRPDRSRKNIFNQTHRRSDQGPLR